MACVHVRVVANEGISSANSVLVKRNLSTTDKANEHHLVDVEKFVNNSVLVGFPMEHKQPVDDFISDIQRIVLKNFDINFEHHENRLRNSDFKPQQCPVGSSVRKCFGRHGWWDGKVIDFWCDGDVAQHTTKCEDGDREDVDESQMADLVLKHANEHKTPNSVDNNDDSSFGLSDDTRKHSNSVVPTKDQCTRFDSSQCLDETCLPPDNVFDTSSQ